MRFIFYIKENRTLVVLLTLMLSFFQAKAQPNANFTATPVTGCSPLIVQFTNTSTGNPTSYAWDFGNGATSVLQNPSTTYTLPGTYTVTLVATNAGGSNTKTVTNMITVLGKPVVNFSSIDTAGCPPLTVTFNNNTNLVTPGAGTYLWNFGDGFTSTLQNPSHTYTASGYYNVTLVATNSGGCNSSLTKPSYIHVLTPPSGDFTANPISSCNVPANVSFTSSPIGTAPFTYYWTFGNGNTSTASNPTTTYNTSGVYTVKLILTDAKGCKDTITKTNYVNIGSLSAGFTMQPNPGCINTPVNFTSTSINASNLIWNFGDGSPTLSSTSINVSHVYTTSGTYNVKLIAQNGACSDSIIIPLTINPKPAASFTLTPFNPCPAPATIQFNNTSTGGTSYAWNFGNGGTSTLTNPTYTYNQNGLFNVQLIATNSFGCKDTAFFLDTVKVYDLIVDAGAVPYQGCAPLTVNFSTALYTNIPSSGSNYPWPAATYYWTFGNGQTSTSATPSITYVNPGNYTIYVTVTTVNGCTKTDSLMVLVGPKPTASFTAAPPIICNHNSVTFTNNSSNATSYMWDFGDGGATGAANPTHIYTTSGTYTVILHAYNNGCEDDTVMTNLITVHPPTSKWFAKYNCDTPKKVSFIDTATIGATSRLWWFGDGATSTAISPTHTYANNGIYYVSLITYNNIYNCTDTLTLPVEIIDPVANFSANDTTICKNETITLTSTYTGVGIMYNWRIGNVLLADTLSTINYTFNNTGYYNITVYIKDQHLCWDSFRRSNYVLVAKPAAQFVGSPVVGCTPLNVTFTDQTVPTIGTTITSRAWTYGNGNIATVSGTTASNIYSNAGFYDVKLIVTDNIGCKDTLTKPAYIEARKPIALFTVSDSTSCIGTPLSFINTSTGAFLTAAWTFGDGGTSNQYNPTHSYNQTGNYTVRLIVTDASGCKDTLTKIAFINISKPTASLALSDTFAICPPLNVQFTNTSLNSVYNNWTFGNGSSSSITNPSSIYTNPGIYTVNLIAVNNQGCLDTATHTVNILGYAGGLSYTPLSGCVPLQVQFTATLTNVPSIVWDFSDGTTVPMNGVNTISHTYQTPCAYVPKLILSDGLGCLNSSAGNDTIKVDGVLGGFITSPACINTPVTFTDTSFSFFSAVTNHHWSLNNGQQTGTNSTITRTYNNTGNYPIVLIVTNGNGCKDTVYQNIYINPLPIVSASNDTSICVNDIAILSGFGASNYTWSPNTNLSCVNCTTTQANPTSNIVYTVVGTDANGCANSDNVAVNIQSVTIFSVGDGGEICDDSTFQLSATGAEKYEWTPIQSLNNDKISNPIASPHVTTVYNVTAWEGSCPPDSQKITVIVWPKPIVNAGSDETIVSGQSVMLNATGSNTNQFIWSPINTLSCSDCSNPTAKPIVTTMYKVVAISSKGCKSSDSVQVNVICDQSQVFIPNTFTPNGDGQNDIFFPRGAGLKIVDKFSIYNRWGELVYEQRNFQLNDENAGWNGSYKGKEITSDVFVYYIEGTCDGGEKITWKGDISLIR